jgi:cytochrome P450
MTIAGIATPIARPGGVDLLFAWRRLPLLAARAGAWLAQACGRPLRLGSLVIAARHADVLEALDRDLDYRIRPVYAARFEEIGYPFILGMDRSAQLARERGVLYEALSRVEMAAVRRRTADEITRRLPAEVDAVDVVEDYARPVAAATARDLFGVAPSDEALFMDAARAMFGHCFFNLKGDEAVKARALAAARLLSGWLDEEIARRRAAAGPGEDMMGQLLRLTSDDDLVRRTLGGVLVGAIDTTATAVAKIVTVLMDDPRAREAARRDISDPERLFGWCQEALRRWTHAPVLSRQAAGDSVLAGVAVPDGAKVVLWTQAAMFDTSAFPKPDALRPDRDGPAYLHLGAGLHPCAGRAINAWQIPMLAGRLLERPWAGLGPMQWAGPFPARLPLRFRSGR